MDYHPVVTILQRKWKKGHSPMVAICGETNSGKTYTALALSDILMKGKFNPAKNMFVDIKDFMLKFYSTNNEVFIIDEAKIHLDSSRWYDNFNKLFGDIVATQRHRNNLYIVILPVLKKLAKEHRDMIDVIIEMKRAGFGHCYHVNRRWSELKEFELWKFFLGGIKIPKPRQALIDKYKSVERVSKDKILDDIVNKVIKVDVCDCGKSKPNKNKCSWCGERVGIKNRSVKD